jgi:putative peptide zinc metalloprotease protein
VAAVTLILVQFDTFYSKLPEFYSFFSPVNIVCLGIVLACTKVVHEFGHGLTAKHFKGECHELGIMILVLNPCLYVNVSDSWLLPNKWHRIAIGAAGVCIECTLAAICTFIWWFTEPGLLHYLALNIMFISSVSTILFNINPLLRFDGYFMLADYLEIPNLRQKATKLFNQKCQEWLLGMETQDDPFLPQKNQIRFALFSVAAWCYRWVIMASILFVVYTIFKRYDLKIIGQAIAAMSLFSLFVMPIIKVFKFFWVPGRIYKVKKVRFYTSFTLFIGLLMGLCFYPLPYTVIAPVIIELRTVTDGKITAQQVFVPELKWGSQLHEIHVVPGQRVQTGDVLAVLDSPMLRMELIEAEGRQKELENELESLESTQHYQSSAGLQIGPLQQKLAAARELLQNMQREVELLVLRAPIEGIVVSPPWKSFQAQPDDQLPQWWGTPLESQNLNATLESGTVVCSIGDPRYLEAIMVVDQSKYNFLQLHQRVELKLHEFPDLIFFGTIAEIEKHKITALEPQLSTSVGGEVPTTRQQGTAAEEPNSASYRVRMVLDNNPDLSIRVGMTGASKIHVDPQTLGYRLWLTINETFNFRL